MGSLETPTATRLVKLPSPNSLAGVASIITSRTLLPYHPAVDTRTAQLWSYSVNVVEMLKRNRPVQSYLYELAIQDPGAIPRLLEVNWTSLAEHFHYDIRGRHAELLNTLRICAKKQAS